VRIRREPKLDARGELYMVLETLSEVLDHSLEKEERNEIKYRLKMINEKTDNPAYIKLSKELIEFIESDTLRLSPEKENFFDKTINFLNKIEEKHLTFHKLKALLILSLIILGVPSSMRFANYVTIDKQARLDFLKNIVSELPESSDYNIMWAKTHVIIDGIVGLIMSLSAILILFGKIRWGTELGSTAILISLVAVNFILFYIQQFSSIIIAAYQYFVLQSLYYFERKWIKET
jgi:hypothetical protein